MAARVVRLTKLTDLFEEGVVAPLKTEAGSEVIVWMNKLSAFESEQASHEGRVARARLMLAIREVGTPESDLFRLASEGTSVEETIEALLVAKDNERTVKVIRELRADKDWKERLEILEWSGEQLSGHKDDDPEVKAVAKVLKDYQAEIEKRTAALRNDARRELVDVPEPKLRQMRQTAYEEQQGIAAFVREQAKSQIYYSMRVCVAERDDGRFQHLKCDHTQRWLDDRRQVDQLPELLLSQVRAAYDKLTMDPDMARFLEGPASSSESHGPSSKPEESKGSGPEVTSDEPAMISS